MAFITRVPLHVVVILLLLKFSESATVTGVTPSKGSKNGETRLTLAGTGFAANLFNFGEGNAHLGNNVTLVSGTQQLDCQIHKDGTHETQIQCYTPVLPEDKYYIRVSVDGNAVAVNDICSNCHFTSSADNTPIISSIEPRSGPPGTIVKLYGKIFTDKYGSNRDESSNGRTASILRVYVGGQSCELKKNENDFYGIELDKDNDNNYGDYGYIKCKIGVNGTKIGNINASFIISDEYGRSEPNKALYIVRSNGQVAMFQTYPEVTSVTPSTGSVEGGTLISIAGNNFDQTRTNASVSVGGTSCTVKSLTKTLITCETSAKPGSTPTRHAGNRGLKLEIWNATTKTQALLSEVGSLDSNAADYFTDFVDETYYTDSTMDNMVTKMSGFFVPPHDGEYSFHVKSDDGAELYLSTDDDPSNMERIAYSGNTNSYESASSQSSPRKTLSRANKYYMEIYHREVSNDAFVKAAVRFYDTNITSDITNNAKAEVQKMEVSSIIKRDIQSITFTGFSSGSSTSAVQTVTVENVGGAGGQFRLSLYNAFTDLIDFRADSTDVADAINNLAVFINGESVAVTDETFSTNGIKYTVTFTSDRGAFPNFEYEAPDSLSVAVTSTTTGVPSGAMVTLSIAGMPAPPVAPDVLPDELKTAMVTLFGTRCPRTISAPRGKVKQYTFESSSSTPSYNRGNRYSEIEAFCGRYVLKNPRYIFRAASDMEWLSLTLSPKLCFAHQGAIGTNLRVSYQYKNQQSETVEAWSTLTNVITTAGTTEWEYSCVDVLTALNNIGTGWSKFLLKAVIIYRSGDVFIDEVYMGTTIPTTDVGIAKQRLKSVLLNSYRIDDVTVTGVPGSYQVTIIPFNCGYQFPMFTTESGQVKSEANVLVTRVQEATPPIQGTFDLTFKGATLSALPITMDTQSLEENLETINGLNNVSVTKVGDCANFNWLITYDSLAGDQSLIQVDASSLTGNSVSMLPKDMVDGHLLYDPIPGGFLRVPEEKAQVVVMNNDVISKCSGTCEFDWLTSSTPTVTGISPGTGQKDTVATITGTGFNGTPSDNSVMIGGVACVVNASTSTSIICTIGSGPEGIHKVNINVAGSGLAQHSGGDVQYIYTTGINSFSPASSSLGGGVNLTVDGYGFRNDATVTVDGQDCPVISSSPDQLVCVIPPKTSPGAVSVVVAMTGVASSTASSSFTYDSGITAQISSITPVTSGVKGGATMTITGSGFGSSRTLIIGGTVVTPLSYSNTIVTATLPSLTPGLHPVQVIVGTDGAAVLTSTNAVPTINYIMKVTNVYPLQGSLHGGTKVTILGEGLGADAEVKIGDTSCDVDAVTATSTRIECTIGDTGTTHRIDNQGSHFEFGTGYGWNPRNSQVKLGDTLHWSWSYPSWVEGQTPRVEQTPNASATTAEPDGFSSGPTGSKSGAFEFKLNTLGQKYFWSGYVNIYLTAWFRGSVDVINKESYVGDLSVKIGGIEASYEKNSGVSNPSSSGPCVGTLSTISGCTDPAPTGGDATKFNFKFWSCLTPTVTSLNRNNGTANDDIVLAGTGLSTTNCQNEVMFGSDSCTVSAASSSSITCKLDSSSSPPVGVQQPLAVRVGNLGNARIAIDGQIARTFAAIPVVSSFSPVLGSLEGSTPLTINGAGFQGSVPGVDVTVTIGGYPCSITSFSYTSIVCSTPKSITDGAKTLEVKVSAGGQMVTVECQSCDYTYDLGSTPSVESVSPTSVDGSATTLVITGKRFGTSANDASVTVGGEACTVTDVTTTTIKCTLSAIPVGSQTLVVDIAQKGHAKHDSSPVTVTGQAVITSVSPAAGSTNGGTKVTVVGNGFKNVGTTVTVDGTNCPVASVTLSTIVCTTAAHVAANNLDLIVTSGGTAYTAEMFSYTAGATPVISSISPTSGSSGDTVTLSGTNLGATIADNNVTLGEKECVVTAASTTEITCTVGEYRAGSYAFMVDVAGAGYSNNDKEFTFNMAASSINPNSGSTSGDQVVTISGSGFDDSTSVTICSQPCTQSTQYNSTETQFICVTPAASGTATEVCTVTVTVNTVSQTLSYTYDSTKTPEITSVTPQRGGTGGGTRITVIGSGFGTVKSDCAVSIEGSVCVVDSVSNTQIVCDTGSISASVRGKVRVEIAGNGQAIQTGADYHYVDVWSSVYSWGGVSLPTDGDLVVIQAGQTIYLDTTTATLKMLLIQGGELIFDDNQDVELKSEIILVTNGGLFQVGTEQAPFQHKATITLYGHHRSKELPIYGTKTLAIREGTLDLHGIPTPVTWTKLSETASAGSNVIKLEQAVNWNVGDKVVIATTGDFNSQSQNEQKTITNIAGDKKTLTLDSNLANEHIAVTESFGTSGNAATLTFAAEVGLLTHNVKVQGNSDAQWIEKIEACPDGFNTGEFATQTCFQGRFGEEMGSDQFGGQIMIHAPEYDTHKSTGRIEYVELFHMGQAFRLGRYPLHFHLNGDMSHSYARGLGIHETFNRAVNIHGTHNLLVEHIVIFNIMGGSFFLEDGIETGNIIQYNLAVFSRSSSSLLNDDVTPASFWCTNPNNTIQHNSAAGGTHFGFWYRMHDHPEGPSFTTSVCPKLLTLGVFYNNSAHSFGWFGLWIFPTYTPRVGGICGSAVPTPVVFDSFFTWNNEKGVETVNTGALQFSNIQAVANKKAGFEGKLIVEGEDSSNPANEAAIKDSLIVGHASFSPSSVCTNGAIVFPYGFGFQTSNVEFVNFDKSTCSALTWTRIDGTCGDQCAGFVYKTSGLTFTDSPNRGRYAWLFEGVLHDTDGTLCNSVGCKVIPTTETLPPSCTSFSHFNFGIPASVCPSSVKFHRFGFNKILPASLEFKQSNWTNQYGSSLVEFRDKRITHKKGWVLNIVSGETYNIAFVDSATQTNLSFAGTFYHFESNDYIYLRQKVNKKPDRLKSNARGFIESSDVPLDPNTHINGDWTFDHYTNEITLLVKGSDGNTGRKKRGSPALPVGSASISFDFQAFKCFYTNCTPPPDPNTVPPVTQRPSDFVYWSESNSWTWLNNTLPVADTDLTIPTDVWMVADMAIPSFNKVILYGTLEFDHGTSPYRNIDLNATHIIILGGRLIIGWPDAPYLGNSQVILRGDWNTPEYTDLTNAPDCGAKATCVFGGLDLHGIDVGVSWTRLASTAVVGDTTITLAQAVNWTAGSEIVLAPTSYDMWETETFRISSVSQDGLTLTLNSSLLYKHVVHSETIDGKTINLGAEVGLLSRNVKVIGEDYSKMFKESFGARMLVGTAQQGSSEYIGYARLSNVEFFHTGQESYTEFYDARFSLTFLDGGTVSNIKPSYVNKCAFHNGFSPAIGVFGTHGLPIEDNVVHHTVWWAIETSSDNTQLRRNLVTLVIWEGAYQNRQESSNYRHNGGIMAPEVKQIVVEDNVVAGAERAAYRLGAMECGSAGYGSNLAHSSLMGFGIYPEDILTGSCVLISNFTAWKCRDVGIYYQNALNVEIQNAVLVENTVGGISLMVGPSTVNHEFAEKYVSYKDSWVVGATSSFDCTADAWKSDENIMFSGQARTWVTDGSHVGIGFPIFSQSSNNMPKKPHVGTMSYNAIGGLTKFDGVHFAHFKTTCGRNDFAVTTNAKGDDLQHPIESRNAALTDVATNNKIFYHRPNVGKINSADCVDMDCDGLKKDLFSDVDGTFLGGSIGAVVSESEWQWGGDRRRGLGDYRIPKSMLTELDGTRIPVDDIAPNKGIIRNSNCVLNSVWQAYECHDLEYKMLIIESMDADTETRRVSPVAILGDGYLDLINGPQDHGWCSGYTCRKRVSTFGALVATGREYLIHFTGTTPQHLRFFLLNSDDTDSIKLSVWYSQPFRLDVFVDGTVVPPKNSRTTNGAYILDPPNYPGEFMPNVSDTSGQSYQDRDSGILHFSIRGKEPVEVKTIPAVIVSFLFPPMSVDDFFGPQIIQHMAAFLDIPPEKVRLVQIVRETTPTGRRRKRSEGNDQVILEISDIPHQNINDSSELSQTQLQNISNTIINEIQLGNISNVVNLTVVGTALVEPPATPGTPEWNSTTNDSPFTTVTQAVGMRFNPAPEPQHEGVVFKTQPKIQVLDAQGQPITQLGTSTQPWQITASLRPGGSNPLANLTGNLTVEFVNGWANFTDLLITQFGTDFYIDFDLTVPTDSNFSIASDPLTVTGRPIKGSVSFTTSPVIENTLFALSVELHDEVTSELIPDIAWRGHTWTLTAELNHPEHHTGSMLGSNETIFSTSSSSANFYSLNFTSLGIYALKLHIYTTPAGYDFYEEVQVVVRSQAQTSITIEQTTLLVMKFESADYNTVVGTDDKAFTAMMANRFIITYPEILFNSVSVEAGSIVVTYSVSGLLSDVNSTVYGMCESIQNGSTFTFNSQSLTLSGYLTVGGVSYYGVHCGPISTTTTPESEHNIQLALIIALAVVSVLLVLTVLAIVVWKCKVKPKTKTRDLSKYQGYLDQPQTIEDILFREQSFMSIREKSVGIPQAPAATNINNLGYNPEKKLPLPY